MMAEGVVVAASAGEHATASFWGEPLLCGSHAFAGGTPLRGAKPCVLGFCVRGVLCVGHGVSWFFANLLLGLWGGGGPLAWRVGGRRSTGWACRGRRSTGSACRGPAVQPEPALAGSPRMEKRHRGLQEPALAGSPRKASLPSIERQKISITINKDVVQKFNLLRCIWARIICSTVCGEVYRFWK